jgi:hypothetical protein
MNWTAGAAVLTRAIEKQATTTARVVMPQLTNRIVVHGSAPQYTAALAMIIKVGRLFSDIFILVIIIFSHLKMEIFFHIHLKRQVSRLFQSTLCVRCILPAIISIEEVVYLLYVF